ncbi:hypothetical protein N7493_001684 [Penicillium malachiteum]|uniref:Oligopeptide transporter n=1 Tax=Penicillium malachiteum TaxID=1324776 RepID=A0AAD6MZX0_9EURO|nr:hypothetical protein N7493_001684 [Penicillium malachiteum]
MSGPTLSMNGSAVDPAEPHQHSRLVLQSPGSNMGHNTDKDASSSLAKIDQGLSLNENHQDKVQTSQNATATPDELRDLLHVVDDYPFLLWIAALAGILERFVWYGATAPLQNYLQNAPGRGLPGALGLGQVAATNIVNALMIGACITPVPAAVLADSWLGRYKTMIYSAMYCDVSFIIEAIGATILFATLLPIAIREGAALAGVIVACILLAVGSGGFKTSVVPFLADQYTNTEFRIKVKSDGHKVVVSRELTITYIYNVFYWGVNIICFAADMTPLLERYVDFWLAYLIPCCAMWLALIPVLVGAKHFVRAPPASNIMPQVASALKLGIAGGFKMNSAKPEAQVQRGRQVPWGDSFIEDIKRSLFTCRVLLLFPIHWLYYSQTFNNLISQAGQMVTYGIPNDMMKIAGPISGIIVAPAIQKGLYPYLTKRRIAFGPIARMVVGFICLTVSIVYITIVQKLIYGAGPCYEHPLSCSASNDGDIPNQVSVFLQLPIYFIGALAEVFCLTTGTEYAYNNAPDSMKTLVQAIWLATSGIGSCISLAFTPLTEDPYLVTMYAILTGLLGVAIFLLWILFRRLDVSKTEESV